MEWLSDAVAEMDEEGGGVEEEGGAVPVTTTVFAWRTVFVVYVVDVKRVVRAPASEDPAKLSGEEKRMTRAPSRGFKKRIVEGAVVSRE